MGLVTSFKTKTLIQKKKEGGRRKALGTRLQIKRVVFTLLCYRNSKKKKLIRATLNGTMYMNELEIKSRNFMIVCAKVFNYILALISGLESSHPAPMF